MFLSVFHFGQCLWRKFVELGLKVAYGEDELLQKWFRSTVALAFVPRRKVQLMFSDAILDEAPLEKYPQLENSNDYMTETWIDDDSLFSSSLWNHFNNAESRVNNNNEGYNSRFNAKTSNVPHPNISVVVRDRVRVMT